MIIYFKYWKRDEYWLFYLTDSRLGDITLNKWGSSKHPVQ